MSEKISDEQIEYFSKHIGAREIHKSWRDTMLMQARPVDKDRMDWDTLPIREKALDEKIALDVITEFVAWLKGRGALKEEGAE